MPKKIIIMAVLLIIPFKLSFADSFEKTIIHPSVTHNSFSGNNHNRTDIKLKFEEIVDTDILVDGSCVNWKLPSGLRIIEITKIDSQKSGIIDNRKYHWYWKPGLCTIEFTSREYHKHLLTLSYIASKEGSLVEKHLEILSKKARDKYVWSGSIGVLGGIGLTSFGIAILSDENIGNREVGALPLGAGLFLGAMGVSYLDCSKHINREYDNIWYVVDITEREIVGRKILESLAKTGRKRRLLMAAGTGCISLTSLYLTNQQTHSNWAFSSQSTPLTTIRQIALLIWPFYFLATTSLEEKALQNYLTEHEQTNKLSFRITIDPCIKKEAHLMISF